MPTDVSNGWGTDNSPLERPGIPQEINPPQPLASAHWLVPEQQTAPERPLVGRGLALTPVFSTAVPVRGLSGALRKWAYRIPDYRARRWLLLMVADRVDVLEHRRGRFAGALVAAGLVGVGVLAMRRLVR
jgi:hypothetical protein